LEQARRGEFRSPRAVNGRIPPALEAICLKAMAFDPGRRYASALELARDLERWLAGEPVSAWREPLQVKVHRWVTRHTALATGIAVALLAAALLTGVIAVWRAEQRLGDLRNAQVRNE